MQAVEETEKAKEAPIRAEVEAGREEAPQLTVVSEHEKATEEGVEKEKEAEEETPDQEEAEEESEADFLTEPVINKKS